MPSTLAPLFGRAAKTIGAYIQQLVAVVRQGVWPAEPQLQTLKVYRVYPQYYELRASGCLVVRAPNWRRQLWRAF
jgi:hypothetical protein